MDNTKEQIESISINNNSEIQVKDNNINNNNNQFNNISRSFPYRLIKNSSSPTNQQEYELTNLNVLNNVPNSNIYIKRDMTSRNNTQQQQQQHIMDHSSQIPMGNNPMTDVYGMTSIDTSNASSTSNSINANNSLNINSRAFPNINNNIYDIANMGNPNLLNNYILPQQQQQHLHQPMQPSQQNVPIIPNNQNNMVYMNYNQLNHSGQRSKTPMSSNDNSISSININSASKDSNNDNKNSQSITANVYNANIPQDTIVIPDRTSMKLDSNSSLTSTVLLLYYIYIHAKIIMLNLYI